MFFKAMRLKGYKLNSLDGEIGKVDEFYFDDRHWAVRYLVADTGTWLTGRQVLISPYALTGVEEKERCIAVNLTKKQIEDSPSLDSDKPVSRQFEADYHDYFGWPLYWTGPYMWGAYPQIMRFPEHPKALPAGRKKGDAHLRSTREVTGYHLRAADGEIGHVDDFIIDDGRWAIRYLVIDTRILWTGKKVLISPRWIESISWGEEKVFVNVDRETVKGSPEYNDEALLTREYESRLHGHYNRQGYWIEESTAEKGTHRH
jgi:hypothetical protein